MCPQGLLVMSPHQPPWASGHRPTSGLGLVVLGTEIWEGLAPGSDG